MLFGFIFNIKVHDWDSVVLSETGSYKQSTVLNNNIAVFGQTLTLKMENKDNYENQYCVCVIQRGIKTLYYFALTKGNAAFKLRKNITVFSFIYSLVQSFYYLFQWFLKNTAWISFYLINSVRTQLNNTLVVLGLPTRHMITEF